MKALLVGYGKMGRMLEEEIVSHGGEVVGVVHPGLFARALDVPGKADVLLDFSYPGNLAGTLQYGLKTNTPLVIGTTGLTEEQTRTIATAAKSIPVVHSANYSIGIAVLKRVLREVAPRLLDSFDAEIVETHHNQKQDAPSGTAKVLLEAIDPDNAYAHVFGREGMTGVRGKEIGVHALRGGTVAGEHSVFFFGNDEILEFKHTAASRRIFVSGAVRTAQWAIGKPAGLYGMDDVMGGTRVER